MRSRMKLLHKFVPQQNHILHPENYTASYTNTIILKQFHFTYMVLTVVLFFFLNTTKYGEERERERERERETNKMQLIWCLLSNFYLNMFRA